MASSPSGSFRFLRVAGIQVYVHWSWFAVAYLEISTRQRAYSSWVWNVLEYLGLFLIVLLHEFGHAFACRQTGGVSNEIVLWPLGGIAFGTPPPRPKAQLWTVAAGPLVNVALWPILMIATYASARSGSGGLSDLERLLIMLWLINKWLLIFNLLPVYPLDGGQILRSLLWFKLGRGRSLQVAAVIGLIGIGALALYRVATSRSSDDILWTGILGLYLGSRCLAGLRLSRALIELDRIPRRRGFACPQCHANPPAAALWICGSCGHGFDPFLTQSVCPHCSTALRAIRCVDCGAEHSLERWDTAPPQRYRADGATVIDV